MNHVFEIVEFGGRHNAVFPTFVIPAPTRQKAEELAARAVALGRLQAGNMSAAVKDRQLAVAKAMAGKS